MWEEGGGEMWTRKATEGSNALDVESVQRGRSATLSREVKANMKASERRGLATVTERQPTGE